MLPIGFACLKLSQKYVQRKGSHIGTQQLISY